MSKSKHPLRKLKVLEYDISDWQLELFSDEWVEIPGCKPLGRPGKYLLGDICWFETVGRDACYEYSAEMFKYQLSLLEAAQLNDKQIQALEQIVAQKLATKAQQKLLYLAASERERRQIGRNATLYFNRGMKRK